MVNICATCSSMVGFFDQELLFQYFEDLGN